MNKTTFLLLKVAAFTVFLGRGYQHLFWDAPYRSLLWDQKLLEPIMSIFHMDWKSYVTSLKADDFIQNWIRGTGILYVVCAIVVASIKTSISKWKRIIVYIGFSQLLLLSVLLTKEKFYHLAMFFEHSIQFTTPILFIWYIIQPKNEKILLVLKIIIALTFLCHGLYASGFAYPLPASFMSMTATILKVSDATAKMLLIIAAILDVIIAIGIFIPKIDRYILLYAAFWGLITALARPWSNLMYDFSFLSIHQSIHLMLYRLSHGLIPLALFLLLKDKKDPRRIFSNKHTEKL